MISEPGLAGLGIRAYGEGIRQLTKVVENAGLLILDVLMGHRLAREDLGPVDMPTQSTTRQELARAQGQVRGQATSMWGQRGEAWGDHTKLLPILYSKKKREGSKGASQPPRDPPASSFPTT